MTVSGIFIIFAPDYASLPTDRASQRHRWNRGHQAARRAGLERTISERYLLSSQLRNLKLNEKKTATKRLCWVYYTVVYGSHYWLHASTRNTRWRGLAKLLISIEWQCEGRDDGISDRKFLPRPFSFPIPYSINRPRQGGARRQKHSVLYETHYFFIPAHHAVEHVRSKHLRPNLRGGRHRVQCDLRKRGGGDV